MTSPATRSGARAPWIGLVHVKPVTETSPLGTSTGAFSPVVALATSSDDFARVVHREVSAYGMVVIEIENVEPLSDRMRTGEPDPALVRAAAALSSEAPIAIGVIDSYTEDLD